MPRTSWILTCCGMAVMLAVLCGCDGGKTHELWNDAFHCHGDGGGAVTSEPPRPASNSTSDNAVQAGGGSQSDLSGLVENNPILGEPLQAGTTATAGTMTVRHGFTPPMPPSAPSGIAQVSPASSNLDKPLN